MTPAKPSNSPQPEQPAESAGDEPSAQPDEAACDLSIQIELEYPGEFLLFCVPATSARETHNAMRKSFKNWLYDCEIDEYIGAVAANTKLTTNLLPNNQLEEFYHFVENGALSEEMQHRCFQAEMVVQLLAEGNDKLTFFAPFWTAMVAGSFLTADLDAILVDAYNSRGFPASFAAWQHHVDGVPLAHQFLNVTGNAQDGQGNKMRMHTTGMSRFGLPELVMHEVAPEHGQEMAYLLRGLAQYMWCTIEKLLPTTSTLQLNEELDLPSSFCELDKAQACKIGGQLLPISLCWGESHQGRSNLIVSPTMDFEAEEDWFETIVNAVRREKLQLSALSSDRLIL